MKICIDPGHGMSNRQPGIFDPGATHFENGFEFEEAAIVLRYGLALKDVFRARQVDVFMTRDDASDHTPVGRRASMAKSAGCDILVSLHMNDFDDDGANGFEVLYGQSSSEPFAAAMQATLLPVIDLRDRKIKIRSDLAVLKFAGPAVLIELGFIANDKDRNKILAADTRDAVVHAIADVVMSHSLANQT
ncbi:N-acetylmuramoyl-L-alanine amidase [Variovorax sp. OV084]|uniref:N-acetylmuramoyl-L-alanine amidase n=1 Tax=Variovorax sp. OV084 TaxID=1882777 RepID=UPI0008CE47B4|nr:N-acetylmuramoyl-L-alanine amidase [Variovorax sp. OV084]SEU23316.1 N-acetylmuramoyl-L-alanine amidase [Variovorax sp. OV084]